MISKEIRKKVKKIQLKVNKLINEVMTGHYVSAFKGVGIEFDEVREYLPGDDVRFIDWNVTARTGTPFIKRYVEERELTVMLMVDLSASQRFGTMNYLKSDLAAEVSALLAFLAIKNNDKVGLLIFSDSLEKYVPPKKGRCHVLRVIREILGYRPAGTATDITEALKFVNRVLKHRSIVFLISDFLNSDFEKILKNTARHHDVVAINIEDLREYELPSLGLIEFQDMETGEKVLVDTSLENIREMVRKNALSHKTNLVKIFKASKVDHINISTRESYLDPLQKFFRQREKRFGR